MKKNDKFIGRCSGYNKEGMGIVKYDDIVFFVPGIIRDETAEILIVKMLKNYGYGKMIRLIEESKQRVEPVCPVYKLCGGCHLQHMNREEQAYFKTQLVKDCFRSIANMAPQVNKVLDMADPYRYRNKVQVPFAIDKQGNIKAGFYRQHSNDIVEFTDCLVQTKLSNELIQYIKKRLQDLGIGQYFRHVLIKHAHNTDQIMVVFIVRKYPFAKLDELAEELHANFKKIQSIIVNVNDKETNVILGNHEEVLYGQPMIQEELNGMYFNISSKSFYQINPAQTKHLYDLAIQYANITKNDIVVDLYCGTGTIGLLAAPHAKKVFGIEIVAPAIEDAKINAKNNGIDNIEFINADAKVGAKMLLDRHQHVDVVIVDPPRKGCDQATLEAINIFDPKRLVYVSCDPATLARDIKILSSYGYQIETIQPVDMFPMTNHVETVVLLSHKSPDSVINVKVEFGEGDDKISLDAIAERAKKYQPKPKITYKMIQEYVEKKYGFKVHTAYIAEVKRALGLTMCDAPNAAEELKQPRKHPPKEKAEAIMEALKHFEVI